MAGEFAGKVVIVTGASGNVGSAVVRRFAAGGAKLVLVDRGQERLQTLAGTLEAETFVSTTDVSSEKEVDALVDSVGKHFGRIDALAHTVGGFAMGRKVHEAGLEQLEAMWNLNVRPLYLMCGRVARHMLEAKQGGSIIAIVARSANKGAAGMSAYTASKAASLRVIESLALEVRDQGIRVNALSPSTIDTPANRADMPNADFSKWVTPQQIAETMAFLASDAGAAFNGANFEVFGRA